MQYPFFERGRVRRRLYRPERAGARSNNWIYCAVLFAFIVIAIVAAIIALVVFVDDGSGDSSSNTTTTTTTPATAGTGTTASPGTGTGLTNTGVTNPAGQTGSTVANTGSQASAGTNPAGQTGSTVANTGSPASAGTSADSGGTGTTTAGAQGSTVSGSQGSSGTQPVVTTGSVNPTTGGTGSTPAVSTAGSTAPATGSSPAVTTGGTGTTKQESVGSTSGGAVTTGPSAGTSGPVTTGPSTTQGPTPTCPTSPVLIHQRIDSTAFFDKTWAEMKVEQGTTSGNYWKGLDAISTMSQTGEFNLEIMYETLANSAMHLVKYTTFTVGDESTNYELTINGYSGNFTVNAFQSYTGYKFTTKDRKNDQSGTGDNCATSLMGAWWYGSCTCGACLTSEGETNYIWRLGFSMTQLKKHTMMLVCK